MIGNTIKGGTHNMLNYIFGPNADKRLIITKKSIDKRYTTPHNAALEVSKIIKDGDFLFEGNGGIGGDTLVLSTKFKKVITCETDPETFDALQNNVKIAGLDNVKVLNKSCLTVLESKYPITHAYFDPIWVDQSGNITTKHHLQIDGIFMDVIVKQMFKTIPTLKYIYIKYPLRNNCVFKNGKVKKIQFSKINGRLSFYKLHIINNISRGKIRIYNFKQIMPIPTVNNYLDIGCNNGVMTKEVAELINAKNIYGCDVAENLVEDINYFSSVKFEQPDDKFDFVTCFMVFHHLADQFDFILKNIIRVMKPGSILFIKEHDATGLKKDELDDMHKQPDFEEENTGDLGITKYFTFDELNNILTKSFKLVGMIEGNGQFNPYYAVYIK